MTSKQKSEESDFCRRHPFFSPLFGSLATNFGLGYHPWNTIKQKNFSGFINCTYIFNKSACGKAFSPDLLYLLHITMVHFTCSEPAYNWCFFNQQSSLISDVHVFGQNGFRWNMITQKRIQDVDLKFLEKPQDITSQRMNQKNHSTSSYSFMHHTHR